MQLDYITSCSVELTATELDDICKELELKAFEGNCDRVSELLETYASNSKFPKKHLNIALREAVKGCNTRRLEDSLQCVDELIRASANVNSEEAEEGRTALMFACEKGYLEIVQRLVESGALIDHRDNKKRTALFYAIDNTAQNIDVVQELVNQNADVNAQSINGIFPLLFAAEKKHDRVISILLKHGAHLKH
jgi:ankyrin repeat protein